MVADKHAQVCNSFFWVDLILYTPVNNLQLCQDRSSEVEPVLSKDIMYLAKGNNSVEQMSESSPTPLS